MSNRFEGQCVVVTGGAGALGRAVVSLFESEGARVAAVDISDDVLTSAFPDRRESSLYVSCDLTDADSCKTAVDQVLAEFDHIDVLCNVAGGFHMGESVHETKEQTWDFLMDLNARSVYNMARAVVPGMEARAAGKIVNVSAGAAHAGMALAGAYTASKAAVLRLTETMGLELREKGINVNCVLPSLIDTPRNREDMPDADFSKWVSPDDLAKVMAFLASPDASAIHGAGVPVVGLS